MNIWGEKIFCHICQKWIDKRLDTLFLENDDVVCGLCADFNKGKVAHLGYYWDIFNEGEDND